MAITLAPLAQAGPVQLTMNGNLTGSNMGAFSVGQAFSVSFIYEATGSPDLFQNGEAFYSNHSSYLHLAVGGYDGTDDTGTFGQITVRDGSGVNPDSISFQFGSDAGYSWPTNPPAGVVQLPSVLSGNVNQTFQNMFVNLGSFSSTVWLDHTLPVTYNFADFGQNHSIGVSFSGGSLAGTIVSLSVSDPNQAQAAPEPGTAGLVLTAIGGVLVWRRRQRD
jgi:hypothetical protein